MGRAVLAWTLLALGCVLVVLTLVATWARDQILDTDRYVDTVAPLASDPAIQAAVASRVSTRLIEAADLEDRARETLPPRAAPLAGPIAAAAEGAIRREVSSLVASDEFERLWERVSRASHTLVVNVLTGENVRNVETEQGEIAIDLGPIIDEARERLQRRGIEIASQALVGVPRRFVIAQVDELDQAQRGVRLLDDAARILPFLTLGLLAGAVAVARTRRREVVRVAIGVAVAALLLLVGLVVGKSIYIDVLPDTVPEDAASAFYDQIVVFLRQSGRVLLLIAVLVALVAALAGDSRVARALRGRTGGALEGRRSSAAGVWVADNRNWFRAAIGLALAVSLIALEQPRLPVVAALLAVAAGLLLLVEAAVRAGRA